MLTTCRASVAPHGDHVRALTILHLCVSMYVRVCVSLCVCVRVHMPARQTRQVCTFDNRGVGQSEFFFWYKPKHNLNPTYTFARTHSKEAKETYYRGKIDLL